MGDINRKDARGRTLTMAAAEGGNPECVSMLLNAGARVDAMDNEGWTAVMAAAAGDHKSTLKVLGPQTSSRIPNRPNTLQHAQS